MTPSADPSLPVLRQALVYQTAGEFEEAERLYRRVLQSNSTHAMALHLLGVLLAKTARTMQAVACLRDSIRINPNDPQAHNNLANALLTLGQYEAALQATDRALTLLPNYVKAWRSRSNALHGLKRYAEAARALEHILQIDAGDAYVWGELMYMRLSACDWSQRQQLMNTLNSKLQQGLWVAPPFTMVMYSDDPAVQLAAACVHMQVTAPDRPHLALAPKPDTGKIRIAYLSADFHAHATAYLLAELFELHDRNCVEVWAL
jgi:predicted O-linked N-acetylglucosamine transferase (SPINDLY family)